MKPVGDPSDDWSGEAKIPSRPAVSKMIGGCENATGNVSAASCFV
jgi:hypothetical protein